MTDAWRFGDLIKNGWASHDNPQRCGFFVRRGYRSGFLNNGPYIELTDGKGSFWQHSTRGDHKLTKVADSTALNLHYPVQK